MLVLSFLFSLNGYLHWKFIFCEVSFHYLCFCNFKISNTHMHFLIRVHISKGISPQPKFTYRKKLIIC